MHNLVVHVNAAYSDCVRTAEEWTQMLTKERSEQSSQQMVLGGLFNDSLKKKHTRQINRESKEKEHKDMKLKQHEMIQQETTEKQS